MKGEISREGNLDLVNGRPLDLRMVTAGLLNLPLHIDDGLPAEVTSPSNHVTRDPPLRLSKDGLDSRNSLLRTGNVIRGPTGRTWWLSSSGS